MKERILWCAIALLAVTSAGQAYYIYSQRSAAKPVAQDPWSDQEKWIKEAQKNLFNGSPIPFKEFDDLFDDRFFGRRFDPFAEIENFQRRLNSRFSGDQKSLFGHSWDGWFSDRLDVADIKPEQKLTDKEVVLEFKIPGLEGESLNINVNDDRIRIAYDAKSVQDKKDGKGREYFKSESVRHFEKVMPIPEEADPRKNRIAREGSVVKIIFERRPRGKSNA